MCFAEDSVYVVLVDSFSYVRYIIIIFSHFSQHAYMGQELVWL